MDFGPVRDPEAWRREIYAGGISVRDRLARAYWAAFSREDERRLLAGDPPRSTDPWPLEREPRHLLFEELSVTYPDDMEYAPGYPGVVWSSDGGFRLIVCRSLREYMLQRLDVETGAWMWIEPASVSAADLVGLPVLPVNPGDALPEFTSWMREWWASRRHQADLITHQQWLSERAMRARRRLADAGDNP